MPVLGHINVEVLTEVSPLGMDLGRKQKSRSAGMVEKMSRKEEKYAV